MKNKRILIFILPFLILAASFTIESKAEIISIAITAEVTRVSDSDNLLEGVVKVGDIITGTYTYDTTTPVGDFDDNVALYDLWEPPSGIILNINGYTFKTDPNRVRGFIQIVNDYREPPSDSFYIVTWDNISDLPIYCRESYLFLSFFDPTAEALDSTELPSKPPPLDAWEKRHIEIDYHFCDDPFGYGEFRILGYITSAELIPTGPISQIEDIIKTIEDKLVSGEIDERQAEALITTLDTAGWLLDDGNIVAASNLVDAFIKQVEAMMRSGRLSEEDGQELINAAARARDAFEETG